MNTTIAKYVFVLLVVLGIIAYLGFTAYQDDLRMAAFDKAVAAEHTE